MQECKNEHGGRHGDRRHHGCYGWQQLGQEQTHGHGHGQHHHDPRWEESGGRPFRGGRGPRGGEWFGGPRGGDWFGEPRERAGRGEARYVLLDALCEGPKHGYDIIKGLEERSGGRYAPSPGTVYPTLQYLEEAGLVRVDVVGDRRVYELTDAGKAELEARSAEISAFWQRFASAGQAPSPEAAFLRDAVGDLARTTFVGLEDAMRRGDAAAIRSVREAIERCENDIRRIIAGEKL